MLNRRTNRKKTPFKQRVLAALARLRAGVRYLVPLVVLAAVAVAVPIGAFFAYVHVVSTPYFALDDIRVHGLKSFDKERVLREAAFTPGANAFDVDPANLQARLEAHPWIRRAAVTKRLPRTLEIQIEERESAAVLIEGGVYTLLDAHGEPFKDLEPTDSVDLLALPLITGVSRADAQTPEGREIIAEALDVVRLAEEQKLPALSEVHVDPVMGLSVVPAESGIEIRLGRGRYNERLERLRAVMGAIAKQEADSQTGKTGDPKMGSHPRVDYILLDADDNLSRVTVGSRAMDRETTESQN